ncbi:MAG: TetR family transcriptional regulator [Amycolatopsis sp.]|jgi:TetR/AcrR family transcriptional repressor of nem operon|uniref:TetR/AcrR family transcriptional regulator n=1 Tax=Amycolatopsis sp. TaxID=37632 RepID=UPI0026290328|nr:TetR/AcrR family transcriptional regulator [Amycolatopsis sp.]MCU1682377.1 TetR family transcriptional regulator [Amycolatopsis sp.]
MTTNKPLSHREKLMREGTKQLYEYGFHGTTVDRILEASGVPKGSFYHHFGSKEAFAREALERYVRFQLDLLAKWSAAEDIDTADAIYGYFTDMAEAFTRSRHQRACLLGKLSTEMAAGSPAFRDLLAADVLRWKEKLVDLLQRGRDRDDVREDLTVDELADAVLALIQGVFVLALAVRNKAMLDATGATLRLLIRRP